MRFMKAPSQISVDFPRIQKRQLHRLQGTEAEKSFLGRKRQREKHRSASRLQKQVALTEALKKQNGHHINCQSKQKAGKKRLRKSSTWTRTTNPKQAKSQLLRAPG